MLRFLGLIGLLTFVSACAILPKNSIEPLEVLGVDAIRAPIQYSWTYSAGNSSSKNVDHVDSTTSNEPFFYKEFEEFGFAIFKSEPSDYKVELRYSAMSSSYQPRKDFPFLYVPRYTWVTLSVLSLGVIPYYAYVEQNFVLSVENTKTHQQKKYEINGNYDLWISIFLIHKAKFGKINTIRQEYASFLIKQLLNRFKKDIKKNKI